MVKYLSDNRTDQRFQTILSRPQPFQAEVPEQRYAVDEVDLTPALNVVDAGARAYYAHQGQELERESMAISYDTYQANRAAQQSKAAAKEKEVGLKNTMLNDYAIAVSRQVLDPYMQGVEGMSPVAAERKLRDLREQYIRMTGGVINASDLMKVEKDSGVTFTKDLYNADLQRQNEEYKEMRADVKAQVNAMYDANHPGDNSTIPYSEKAQYAADVASIGNGISVGVASDINIISTSNDPNITSGNYISDGSRMSLSRGIQTKFTTLRRLGRTQDTYWNASQLLDFKDQMELEVASIPVEVNGVRVAIGDVYGPDIISGIVNDAYIKSGIEKPYNQEQAALEATNTELQRQNTLKTRKYIEPVELQNRYERALDVAKMRTKLGSAAIFFTGDNPSISGLTDLQIINPQLYNRIVNALNSDFDKNASLSIIGPVETGETFNNAGKQIGVIDKNGELFIANTAVAHAQDISRRQNLFSEVPPSRWDVASSFASLQNKEMVVLNGNEEPDSPAAEQKQENTKLSMDLFKEIYTNKDWWDSFNKEDQDKMKRWYSDNINTTVIRNLKLANVKGMTENIVYNPSSKTFTAVNATKELPTLFSVVDTLNTVTHTGIKEFDDELLEDILQQTQMRSLENTDRVVKPTKVVEFARAWGRQDYPKALAAGVGAITEGMKNIGETVMEGAVALGEKAGEGAVTVYETMADNVETIADAVLDPNRSASEEYLRGAADTFSDWVLADSNMSPEEKQKAKDEFYNDVVTPAVDTVKDVARPVVDFISDAAEGVSDLTKKYIVEPFKDMLNTVQEAATFTSDITTVPTYNLGIMSRIIKGDNTVTPQEANAALVAYRQASVSDKRKLDKEFNIGPFSENIESQLQEYIRKTPKKDNSKKARSLKEEYIQGIL